MRRNFLALMLGAGALVGAGLVGGYWLAANRSQQNFKDTSPTHTETAASASASQATDGKIDRKVLYWHDPMTPGPRFDKPGKSPFMDMQLVPVYADEAPDEGKLHINPRTVQNLGIRLAEVKYGQLDMGFSVVGAVTIDERSITTVQSRVNGYVEKLHVRAQYDVVAKGRQLVEIYAPDWLAAEEEYLALRRSSQPGVELLAQAARERLTLLGISDDQIRAIETDNKPNPRVTLFAPEGGLVWELGTRDGMAVSPGMTLFKLASLRTVWVNAEVPETQAALAKPGVSVQARVAAIPDKVFKGQIAMLLPDVNATTRTIKARIVLNNVRGELKPGMFATLTLGSQERMALLVPTEAVISTGTRNVVIVANSGGRFQPVDVKLGWESGDLTEIRTGLEKGQQVVVSGQFLIDSESSLKAMLNRMNEAESKP
jgi:Cu(I)/Ag(I) efflux system membrane fusion protein